MAALAPSDNDIKKLVKTACRNPSIETYTAIRDVLTLHSNPNGPIFKSVTTHLVKQLRPDKGANCIMNALGLAEFLAANKASKNVGQIWKGLNKHVQALTLISKREVLGGDVGVVIRKRAAQVIKTATESGSDSPLPEPKKAETPLNEDDDSDDEMVIPELQHLLEATPDLAADNVSCPKCSKITRYTGSVPFLGECYACNLSFCTNCEGDYHGVLECDEVKGDAGRESTQPVSSLNTEHPLTDEDDWEDIEEEASVWQAQPAPKINATRKKETVQQNIAVNVPTPGSASNLEKICPKCKNQQVDLTAVIIGVCQQCGFVYCLECFQNYHGLMQCEVAQAVETDDDISELLEHLKLVDQQILVKPSTSDGSQIIHQIKQAAPSKAAPVTPKFECIICFDKYELLQQVNFGCPHRNTCKGCVKEDFQVQIRDGNVHGLKCTGDKCEFKASPALVKQIVDLDLFDRYDELLLKEVLGKMPEIVNCPNIYCQKSVVAEPEYGYCLACDFRFCTHCNKPYHGVTECGKTDAELATEIKRYNAADAKQKAELEKREAERRKQNDRESETAIKSLCKKCPSCRSNIQKDAGCNHMACTKCNNHFCWICNQILNSKDPYGHFNRPGSKCALFSGQ